MLWLLKNNCDMETAAKIPLTARAPFLEWVSYYTGLDPNTCFKNLHHMLLKLRMPYLSNMDMGPMGKMLLTVDKVEQLPSPRVIRPHLPFYLLPPELLDTSKVFFFTSLLCSYRRGKLSNTSVFRWYTWLVIQRMSSSLIISTTS